MKVCGIIVEYNPFHNGHLYHIKKAREISKCDILIAIMSPTFMQRGEPAIINKFERAKVAIENNVDMLVELPSLYAIQSANYFARGALKILNELNIDTLVFGIETNDFDNLKKAAKISVSSEYHDILKQYLNNGNRYANACNKAFEYFNITKIDQSNDILALSYLQEIYINNYNIDTISIKRTNCYLDQNLHDNISSATAIRHALFNNIDISNSTVMADLLLTKKDELVYLGDFYNLLKYKLYTITIDELRLIYSINEGLEYKFKKGIELANNMEEFIQLTSSKRYPRTRIQRLIIYILANIKKSDIENIEVDYIRILAMNTSGAKYLKDIKKKTSYHIITSFAQHKHKALDLEHKITKLYSLANPNINYLIKKEYQEYVIYLAI